MKRDRLPSQLKLAAVPLRAFVLGLCISAGSVLGQTLSLPSNLISLNSDRGERLLMESPARRDYWPLSIHFVSQQNLAYCGVASAVMVLNALEIPAPVAPELVRYRTFTQNNFFSDKTREVLAVETVARQGMTLEELGGLLESYPVKAEVYHASETNLREFRSRVVKNLREPGNFVLVNYLRSAIGQERGGHISPIAAYHARTDRFLILDVSRYKYPPVWVAAGELWQAMNEIDSASEKTRGFVLVSRR